VTMPVQTDDGWLLIGFDAHAMSECRIRASVDSDIWPSVFDELQMSKPEWTGPVQGLWDDKERLTATLARRPALLPSVKIIAIGVLPESCGAGGHERWRTRLDEIRPAQIERSWLLLGFDVADEYLESALAMEEGLSPACVKPRLNASSLFDRLEEAKQFAALANHLFSEQEPFCVFGIWEVQ
jgi:hypothetical protein